MLTVIHRIATYVLQTGMFAVHFLPESQYPGRYRLIYLQTCTNTYIRNSSISNRTGQEATKVLSTLGTVTTLHRVLLRQKQKKLHAHAPNDRMACIIAMYVYQFHIFLNQACAWFLSIASVRECLYACVCVFACVSAPKAMNN